MLHQRPDRFHIIDSCYHRQIRYPGHAHVNYLHHCVKNVLHFDRHAAANQHIHYAHSNVVETEKYINKHQNIARKFCVAPTILRKASAMLCSRVCQNHVQFEYRKHSELCFGSSKLNLMAMARQSRQYSYHSRQKIRRKVPKNYQN